jgi:hypothetical protein
MFWKFAGWLFVASVVFPFAYSFLVLPLIPFSLGLAGLFYAAESNDHRRILYAFAFPLAVIVVLGSLYIITGWSAYVAARTITYAHHPLVSHPWIYYVVGFLLCAGPLSFMQSYEAKDPSVVSTLSLILAPVMYIVFCVWPNLMNLLYGRLLGAPF